jgi:hypothetical protein
MLKLSNGSFINLQLVRMASVQIADGAPTEVTLIFDPGSVVTVRGADANAVFARLNSSAVALTN